MGVLLFLFQVIAISLSGVMAPGPLTASAIAMGARNRYAGALIAVGHAIIEFPLIILITLGMGKILESTKTQIIIGLAGGAFLLIMAVQMLISLRTGSSEEGKVRKERPVLAGLAFSAGNPYFLVWWATVGINLAIGARQLGVWAFGLFAVVHWLCDFVWLQILSWGSFKGTKLLGKRSQRIILMVCSGALFVFGLFFIYSAAGNLISLVSESG
ncbi:MAG: LysE family transporter [Planctomycetota bacterium]|jgi:threonine/homoserine/homoserine lactone efflux protein